MVVRKRTGGFTLIECMVAIVILAIGVVGVASMFTYASVSEKKAAYMAEARSIADETMEGLRASGGPIFTQASGVQDFEVRGLPGGSGSLAWQPYPYSGSDEGLKLVALSLSWNRPGCAAGLYRVATLIRTGGAS